MKICEYMKEPWFASLTREVEASNKARVAEKMGVNRSTLSAVFNGIGEYGKGKASTEKFMRQFLGAFDQLSCPYTGANVGTVYCRERALTSAPTHNPTALRHWQACQQCANKPRPATADVDVAPKAKGRAAKSAPSMSAATEQPQQAGIIDTVTLPLPEVGAPQVTALSLVVIKFKE